MPSAKLVLAAQTNGKKSCGPKTPEGKRRSAANSRRHGLYGKTIPTGAECEADYQQILTRMLAEHPPACPAERDLMNTVALATARTYWAIRTSEDYFARTLAAQSDPDHPRICGANVMPMLHRLEVRFERDWWRAYTRLRDFRQNLAAERDTEMKERTNRLPIRNCRK